MRTALTALAASTMLLGAAIPAAGQTAVGAKAGVTRSSFYGGATDRAGWLNGVTAGGFGTVHMVRELSFQAELMYVQKGAVIRLGDDAVDSRLRLGYVQAAAALRLDTPKRRGAALHAFGGPAGAVRIACDVGSPDASACDDLGLRRMDWSLAGGFGASLAAGAMRVFVEGRYDVGLGRIDANGDDRDRTNHTLGLVGGVSVPVGKARRVVRVSRPR